MHGSNPVPVAQFTGGKLSRLADMSLPEGERLVAQVAASALLEGRIITADYGRARQPYMFFGFIPGSFILQPWPHPQSRCPTSLPGAPPGCTALLHMHACSLAALHHLVLRRIQNPASRPCWYTDS